jgi:hypothetical protein
MAGMSILAQTVLILTLRLVPLDGQAQTGAGTKESPYIIPRIQSPLKIDGVLDEDGWAKARVLELNYEISPRENVAPPVRTEILITTAAGVQIDGLSDAAGIKDYNWDMIYDTAARLYTALAGLAVTASIIPKGAGGNLPRNQFVVPEPPNADSEKETIPVPAGTSPVIDGTITTEEWQGARRELFSDGSELLLLRHEDDLYLGIRAKGQAMIAGNIFINRGDRITILHASAALGTAEYRKDGEDWRIVRNFSWRCRRTDSGKEAMAERDAFFREEGWIASTSRMGTPEELEFRIQRAAGPLRLAMDFLRASDPTVKVPWPAALDDDCLKPTPGGLPTTLRFAPEKWAMIGSPPTGFPVLDGPYLGQKRPGPTPEIFAPGILSLGFHEHSIAISPDGKEIFFVAASSDFSRYLIMTTRLKSGVWTRPEVAAFSGGRNDGAPAFSPDGKRLYFSSRRPRPASGTSADDFDIWYVERKDDSWTDPANLGGPINTEKNEVNPSVMSDGTIYYQRIDKLGGLVWDLYVSPWRNGTYGVPEKLPAPVNTEANEAGPCIAADGSYLLFQSNRPGGYGVMDLYITYRTKNGAWSEPVNLGDKINSPFSDWGPVLSPDGKYLFFGSFRNVQPLAPESREYFEYMTSRLGTPSPGKGTLYWVEAKIIDALRPKDRNVMFDDAQDRIILECNRRLGGIP